MNKQNGSDNNMNSGENQHDGDEFIKMSSLSPLAAISIITMIGLVCIVIDFYLESE